MLSNIFAGGRQVVRTESKVERTGIVRRLFSSSYRGRESLGLIRLWMVLAGFMPLFILLAIRGAEVVPDVYLWATCAVLVLLPMVMLAWRVGFALHDESPRPLAVGQVEDSRSHILTYLFATCLPFYRQDLGDIRDLVAIGLAVLFIVFLFWHLNLHYVNIMLAVFGFRVYTIRPRDDDDNRYTRRLPVMVITRERVLVPGMDIMGYRITDSLYWMIGP